jgi:predicted PurR-regulated permease PerM
MASQSPRDRLENLAFYCIVLLLGYFVYLLFAPFLVPLGWAGVLVVCCHPWQARLERRFGPTRAAALSTALVAVMIIAPGILIVSAFVREATEAFTQIQGMLDAGFFGRVQQVTDWIQARVLGREPASLGTLARQGATQFAGFLASGAGTVLRNVALFLFDLVVTLFAVFFFFRDRALILRGVRRALPFGERERERMIAETGDLISASVTSGLIVAAVQGVLGGIVFAILGLGAPVFWGVMMGFFALLPFVGSWIIWLPTALFLMSTGDVGRGVTLAALGAGLVSGVDNFLRPVLLSGRARLNGLLVFIGLLGGASVFGLLGLILGPVVIAIAVGLFEAYTESIQASDSPP